MMMKTIAALLLLCGLVALGVFGCASRAPLATVASVDLRRYAGQWYEVARYPNWFQRNCVGETTATYKALPDGAIQVVNSCRNKNGRMESVTGRATVVPGSANTKLKVSFFGPFTGDYWIIGLDQKNYSWAVVGHPSRRYLWILSRTPHLSEADYRKAVAIAVAQGYDESRLIKTVQPKP